MYVAHKWGNVLITKQEHKSVAQVLNSVQQLQ